MKSRNDDELDELRADVLSWSIVVFIVICLIISFFQK